MKRTYILAVALVATSAVAHPSPRIEVSPNIRWVTTDTTGRHEHVVPYAPFVAKDGARVTPSFLQDTDTAILRASLVLRLEDDFVNFEGTLEWWMNLGVTSSFESKDTTCYGTTERRFVTTVRGRQRLGTLLKLGAGEDIENQPFIELILKRSDAPESPFRSQPIENPGRP